MPVEPPVLPTPERDYPAAELATLSDSLRDVLPGYQSSYPDQEGHVLVDVLYDDGTLQDYADAAYGAGVVVVTGAPRRRLQVDGQPTTGPDPSTGSRVRLTELMQ